MKPAAAFQILCVTDRHVCQQAGIAFPERIREIMDAGIPVILREKDLSAQAYQQLAQQLLQGYAQGSPERTRLILHSFVEVAAALQVESIHLPLPVFRAFQEQARQQELSPLASFAKVGVSVHSVQEAEAAAAAGADYLIAGHIFATSCKPHLSPRGIVFLEAVCHAVQMPVYAIGGISGTNLPEVRAAGAAGACIRSGFMQCRELSAFLAPFERV